MSDTVQLSVCDRLCYISAHFGNFIGFAKMFKSNSAWRSTERVFLAVRLLADGSKSESKISKEGVRDSVLGKVSSRSDVHSDKAQNGMNCSSELTLKTESGCGIEGVEPSKTKV